MSRYKFRNRASSTLSHALALDATSIQLASGTGVLFPTLGAGEVFMATLVNLAGTVEEIVQVTAIVGEICTVIRGQEGTAAATFAVGSVFEHRLTAQAATAFFQAEAGGAIGGDLDMQGNAIRGTWFPDPTLIDALYTNQMRGVDVDPADSSFEGGIFFPGGKNPPFLGFADTTSRILCAKIFANIVFPWSGFIAQLEPWWKICDGTNNTFDLRKRFILGADVPPQDPNSPGPIYGQTDGSFAATTNPAGTHNHTGVTTPTRLGSGNLPPVTVNLQAFGKGTSGAAPYPVDGGTTHYNDGAQYTHAHGIPAEGDHAHTFLVIPPFVALIFVQLNIN